MFRMAKKIGKIAFPLFGKNGPKSFGPKLVPDWGRSFQNMSSKQWETWNEMDHTFYIISQILG